MRDGNNSWSSGLDGGTHGWSKLHRIGCGSARETRAREMVLVVDAGSVLSFLPSLAAGAGDGTDRERVAGAGVDLFAMGTTAGCNGAAPAAGSTAVFLGSTAAGCNCAAPAAGSTAGGADSTAAGCNGAAPAAGSTAGGVISTAAGCNGAAPAAGSTAGGEGIAVGREGIVVVCLVRRCLWR